MKPNVLKGKIIEKGTNIEILSKKIGINPSTFYRKLKNDGSTFSVEEAKAIVLALGLSTPEVIAIFFDDRIA